jgi:hypothetical protein
MKKTGNIARISLIAVFSAIALTFTGCVKNNDNIVEQTTLDENGYTDYYLNNPDRSGYTLYLSTGTLTNPLSNYIETNVNKVSGYAYDWQGLFFNYTDGSHFIAVLINTQGSFIIVKAVGENFYYYNGSTWTSTSFLFASLSLNMGYNAVNAIKVKVTAPTTYEVSFNGTVAQTFTETQVTTGLYKGFMFNIDSKVNEGFPDKFFEVKFKEIFAQ